MIIDFLLDDIRKAIAGLEAASFADVEYDSSAHTIDFYNVDGESVGSIDASDFIVDGMLDSVTLSGSTLHFVFNTDSGKEAIDVDLSTIIPDIDKLAPIAELPASAETGTVVALYQEGEAGGGTWKLSQDGSYYYFDCDFSTLDQTQEYPLGLPFDMYQPVRTWDGDFILYYNNGWRIKNGYEVDDGEEPVHYDVDSLLSSVSYSGEWDCETATGDPDNPYISASFGWNNVAEQLEVRCDGHNFNDPGMCQPDLKNISGEAGEPILGLYQYDGQNWNEVGGGNIDELVEMLQAKEEVIASAITELHEAIPDLSDYWTSGETKSYVDGAVGALVDDVADIERVTATALTELHDSILDLSGATADFVTTADTQEIIDRLQTVETVASSAFDYLETMMETKEEVIAEALTDLEDTKVGSEDIKHIVKLTQAEYDLIATPDPETLYIIVNA